MFKIRVVSGCMLYCNRPSLWHAAADRSISMAEEEAGNRPSSGSPLPPGTRSHNGSDARYGPPHEAEVLDTPLCLLQIEGTENTDRNDLDEGDTGIASSEATETASRSRKSWALPPRVATACPGWAGPSS